jgi:hypothetical protein
MATKEAWCHSSYGHGGHRFFKRSVSLLQEQDLRWRGENVQSNLGDSSGEGKRDRMKAAMFQRTRRELKREEVKGAAKCVA